MFSQNLILAPENPRPSAFPIGEKLISSATAKPMNNEIVQKPPPSLLVGRFKAMLKQRDDELRASLGGHVPPPTSEEIVHFFEELLSELTCNLKPIITDLTIIAEQQREHAKGIADAICSRILEVPADQKLPSLYLLDSIVKNFGQEYVRYFSLHLPEVFCEAYRQVQPSLHPAMRHLFGTWSKVFPPSVLRKIEAQLQFSQAVHQSPSINPIRASESPRPSHGIHVNPMYFRKLECSTVDSVGGQKLGSSGISGNANFGIEVIKIPQIASSRLVVSSSLSRIGLDRPLSASIDEYAVDSSATRMVEKESPHPAVDYGKAKALGKNEELRKWPGKLYSGDGRNRFHTSVTYSLGNGHQRQSPRALIDAYGCDKRQETSNNKPILADRLDIDGIDNKVLSTSWQNTEEEEFDWEDMSPTLLDPSKNNGFLPSTVGQVSVFQNQTSQGLGSRNTHDAWKISHHPSNSSEHPFNIGGRAKNLQIPPIDKISNARVNPYVARPAVPRMVSGLESNVESLLPVFSASFEARPSLNVHAIHRPTLNPVFPMQKHVSSQFEARNASNPGVNPFSNKSAVRLEESLKFIENKDTFKANLRQSPNQLGGLVSSNRQNHGETPQQQFFPSRDSAASQLSHRTSLLGHGASKSTAISNPLPAIQFPLPVQSIANNSLHLLGGPLPPLPPGRPSASSQMVPHPNASTLVSNQQPTVAYANLINSLMTQGVISLSNQPLVQDSVGIEFNPDILKVRHESAVSALYGGLPRQCTTCGVRFKCQEEHSVHMDWHVNKNRMSKNRKQKPSRKWFVNERMWLSGAEALGTESVPGFLPTETVEKKDDEELAVPAEEDQNTCALCGEPFDEFYSDETEEWMYRGAVYLNAPKGMTGGMERSQLGPIIHAKCRSESGQPPSDDFGIDDGDSNVEGSQRKRMRS